MEIFYECSSCRARVKDAAEAEDERGYLFFLCLECLGSMELKEER